jgi:hypothetical protein
MSRRLLGGLFFRGRHHHVEHLVAPGTPASHDLPGTVLDQTPREGHGGPAVRASELAARLAHQSALAFSRFVASGRRREAVDHLRRIIWRPSASNNIAASFATARIAPARADFQQMYAGKYMRRGNGEADRAPNRRTVNLRALELPGREGVVATSTPTRLGALERGIPGHEATKVKVMALKARRPAVAYELKRELHLISLD